MSHISVIELGVNDKARIKNFLNHEPSFNGFVISDLEYGNDEPDFARIYGECSGRELKSVLVIFRDKMVYYSPHDRPVDCYIQHVRRSNVTKLVGKKELVDKFVPFLDIVGQSNCEVRELSNAPKLLTDNDPVVKRMTSREEAAKLYELFLQVEEYDLTGTERQIYIDEQMKFVQNDTVRTYFAEINGEMVSTAAYMNDREGTAIVIGVATPAKYRKKGFASGVLFRLCSDAVNQGKTLYLFYTNPLAGSVYRNLGFEKGGEWKVLTLR